MNDIQPIRMFGIFDKGKKKHQAGSVWDKEKIAPTLDTMMGGVQRAINNRKANSGCSIIWHRKRAKSIWWQSIFDKWNYENFRSR